MAKLTYSMFTSLDGYAEDGHGGFGWGAPEDEELHSSINELESSFGPYLYGRRMYETMVYWETAHTVRDQPQFVLDFARDRKSTRLNSSHLVISYAVFCLKKKKKKTMSIVLISQRSRPH